MIFLWGVNEEEPMLNFVKVVGLVAVGTTTFVVVVVVVENVVVVVVVAADVDCVCCFGLKG